MLYEGSGCYMKGQWVLYEGSGCYMRAVGAI